MATVVAVVTVVVPTAASASWAVPRGRRPDDLLGRAGRVGGLRLHRDRDDEGRSRHDGSSQCFFEHGYPFVGSVMRKRMKPGLTELESIHRTLDLDPDSHARCSKRPQSPIRGQTSIVSLKKHIGPKIRGILPLLEQIGDYGFAKTRSEFPVIFGFRLLLP
ncbi:hypothetical protein [Microbispora bryophytorum]|uniref:hypothetical protein n=1 Tax=Microbispora bryophytorum TaxID=1460882 RepID=UPI003405513B